jgi:phosphomethylpyrimidine synthase
MCGPKFCSMRISQDIRDAALAAGMEQKAREFRESGGDTYLPEISKS